MAKFERLTTHIPGMPLYTLSVCEECKRESSEEDREDWRCPDCDAKGDALNRLGMYEDSGMTPERVQELGRADADMRLMVMPELPQDMGDPMEPLKIEAAARSVLMKIDYLKEKDPSKISPLDYTLYACCYHALEQKRDELLAKESKADD